MECILTNHLEPMIKAPKITCERGLPLNKGSIHISETSPLKVRKAYLSQFQEDFLLFLKCRSPEMVPNGRILFTINGRKSGDPIGKESLYNFELLSRAISYMVSKVKYYQILSFFLIIILYIESRTF